MAFLGSNPRMAFEDRPSPQDYFFSDYDGGRYLAATRDGEPLQFGYDTLGSPQANPVTIPTVGPAAPEGNLSGVSPGGTNEIVGATQTDYSGGFDTRAMEDPLTGPTMPPEYRTQSEIGAPVTETPPELRTGTVDAAPIQDASSATGTAAAAASTESEKGGDGLAKAAGAATAAGQIVGGIMNITQGVEVLSKT